MSDSERGTKRQRVEGGAAAAAAPSSNKAEEDDVEMSTMSELQQMLGNDEDDEREAVRERPATTEKDFHIRVNLNVLRTYLTTVAAVGEIIYICVHSDGCLELRCTHKSMTRYGHLILYDVEVIDAGNSSFQVNCKAILQVLKAMNDFKCETVDMSLVNHALVLASGDGRYTNTLIYRKSNVVMEVDEDDVKFANIELPTKEVKAIFSNMVGESTKITLENRKLTFSSSNDDMSPSFSMNVSVDGSYSESFDNSYILVSKFTANTLMLTLATNYLQILTEIGDDNKSMVQHTVLANASGSDHEGYV